MIELKSADEEEAESKWLLGTIDIDLWHVHVVDEHNHLLTSSFGSILFEGLLVDVLHEVLLEVSSGGSRREVDIQNLEPF